MQYHEVPWKCTGTDISETPPVCTITANYIKLNPRWWKQQVPMKCWYTATRMPIVSHDRRQHHWEKPRCCEWRKDHSFSTTFTVPCLVNLGHELLDKVWAAEVLFWFPSIILMWEALPVNEKFTDAIFLEMNLHHFVHLHRRPNLVTLNRKGLLKWWWSINWNGSVTQQTHRFQVEGQKKLW